MKIEIDPKAKLVGKKNLCALKIFGFWKSQVTRFSTAKKEFDEFEYPETPHNYIFCVLKPILYIQE